MVDRVQIALPGVVRILLSVASYFGGIGAVCTAVGFLAEGAHLRMLGLPNVSIDVNQYLYTGARFLAILPQILVLGVLWGATTRFLPLCLLIGVMFLVRSWAHRAVQPNRVQRLLRFDVSAWFKQQTDRNVSWTVIVLTWMLVIVLAEFYTTSTYVDLLQADAPAKKSQSMLLPLLGMTHETIESSIRRESTAADVTRYLYFSFLVLVTSLSAWAVWYSVRHYWPRTGNYIRRGFLIVNVVILLAQVLLLPVNYGILFLRSSFPQVTLDACASLQLEDDLLKNEVLLVGENSHGFYLFIKGKRAVCFLPRGDVRCMVHRGSAEALIR